MFFSQRVVGRSGFKALSSSSSSFPFTSFQPLPFGRLFSPPISSSPFPSSSLLFRTMSTTFGAASQYSVKEEGKNGTESFRLFVHDAKTGQRITPWHDIPLAVGGEKNVWNFLNEIPKGTNAKMEMATGEPFTPIKQDMKKGSLRFLKHGNVLHNYGCLPQTWENPKELHPSTNLPGDGDPVDVIEIGSRAAKMGEVYPVKVLGVLALIDEGETDWKLLAIAVDDPKAPLLNDVPDVEKHLPGVIDKVREWYRIYKVADGKHPNEYAFGGAAKGKDFAIEVIHDTHRAYLEVQKPKAKL